MKGWLEVIKRFEILHLFSEGIELSVLFSEFLPALKNEVNRIWIIRDHFLNYELWRFCGRLVCIIAFTV